MAKLPKETKILDAIAKFSGNLRLAANDLGITRIQLRNWIYRDKARVNFMFEAREELIESAETTMNKLMQSEDDKVKLDAAKFILSTLGTKYGYSNQFGHQGIQLSLDENGKVENIAAIFGLPEATTT